MYEVKSTARVTSSPAARRPTEKRARRVRVVTVRGSRKGGAKFGETFEGGEPGAALVPVAGGEGHLRGLRGGEIRHGERRGQVLSLATTDGDTSPALSLQRRRPSRFELSSISLRLAG